MTYLMMMVNCVLAIVCLIVSQVRTGTSPVPDHIVNAVAVTVAFIFGINAVICYRLAMLGGL